jgi:uncharacterized membrane protein
MDSISLITNSKMTIINIIFSISSIHITSISLESDEPPLLQIPFLPCRIISYFVLNFYYNCLTFYKYDRDTRKRSYNCIGAIPIFLHFPLQQGGTPWYNFFRITIFGGILMNRTSIQKLTYTALFTALVAVLTYATKIPLPIPGQARYVHLGDAMIYIAAILGGGWTGAFAGGVGSALSDLMSGYPQWAIPMVVIKGIMGGFVGFLVSHKKYVSARNNVVMFAGGVILTIGVYLTNVCVFGINAVVQLATMHFSFIQFIAGMLVANLVLLPMQKVQTRLPFFGA